MASRLLLVLLSMALLTAGCLQTGAKQGNPGDAGAAPALPTTLAPLTRVAPVLLGPGDGEPNIAVAPDGTVYVTPVSHVYVSTDGGKTFVDRGTDGTTGHGDGDIAIDDRGCVHWLGLGGGIPWQVSCDQGKTFSKPVDLSNGTGVDREWIDAAGAQVVASWRDSGGYVSITSQDHGATWGPKVDVSGDFLGGPNIHDPRDPRSLWIPANPFNGEIDLFHSTDAGATWDSVKAMDLPRSAAEVVQDTQIFPVVAQDDAGNLYVVVSSKQPAAENVPPSLLPKQANLYGVYLTVSTDEGKSWSDPRLVSAPGLEGVMPFVTAGADGRIAVVWYESTVGAPDDYIPNTWNVKMLVGLDEGTSHPQEATVQLNDAPNHIGSLCSNGLVCAAGGDRCLLDFFEVALDPKGLPVATWSSCTLGTGVGVAVQGTDIYFGGIADGTPLR